MNEEDDAHQISHQFFPFFIFYQSIIYYELTQNKIIYFIFPALFQLSVFHIFLSKNLDSYFKHSWTLYDKKALRCQKKLHLTALVLQRHI